MDKIMENKKGLELVTFLFELQNMFTKIHFLAWPFESGKPNLETGKKREKTHQNIKHLKNEKSFLEEIKTIFHSFEMLSLGKI